MFFLMSNRTTNLSNGSLPQQAAIIVLMSSCVICVVSNVFVIYRIATVRRLKTVTNTFVCSICLCNIMFAVILLPVHCFHRENLVFDFIAGITILVYICNLTAASYDRLLSITQPMQYAVKLTKKRARLIVLVMWLLPIAYNLIPLTWILTTRADSDIFKTADDVYRLLTLLLFLLCPLLFIIFVYIKVCIEMKQMHKFEQRVLTPVYYQREDLQILPDDGKHSKSKTLPQVGKRCMEVRKQQEMDKKMTCKMTSLRHHHLESASGKPTRRLARRDNNNSRSKSNILKKKAQELKKSFAFLIVAMTYMFTWLPVMVLTLMHIVGQPPIPHLTTMSQYAIALNALSDPFLYGLLLPDFRKTLQILFKRLVGERRW